MILDTSTGRLIDGQVIVRFTRQQTAILEALARSPVPLSGGCLANKAGMVDRTETRNGIKVRISQIRAIVKKAGMQPLISSKSGFGYRLMTPVKVLGSEDTVTIPKAVVPALRQILSSHPNGGLCRLVLEAIA